MRRPSQLVLVFLVWLFCSASAAAEPEPTPGPAALPARILVTDAMGQAGRPVVVQARVERATLLKQAVAGEQMAWTVDNRPAGVVLTGGDGVAVRELSDLTPGIHRLRATLKGRRYRAEAATGLVAVWPAADPLLLVHLEWAVLARPAPRLFRLKREGDWPLAERADAVLRRLSRTYHLVFFTTQAEDRLPAIRKWLTRHRLPRAPVLVWPGDAAALTDRIEESFGMAAGWTAVKAGVGSSAADAEAFLEEGLKTFILQGENDEQELPDGAITVEDWRAVLRYLRAQGK